MSNNKLNSDGYMRGGLNVVSVYIILNLPAVLGSLFAAG